MVATVASAQTTVRRTTTTTMTRKPTLAAVLSDRTLWGKDFPLALGFISSWHEVNEDSVYVQVNRIVGINPIGSRDKAERLASRLNRELERPRPTARPNYAALLRTVPRTAPLRLRASVTTFAPDDDAFHVALGSARTQFFAPRLSVALVRRRLGPPESVVSKTVQTETERRPVILTLHSYFDGTLVFIESDWAPDPGYVDRVLFNVPKMSKALFR